MRCTIRYQSNEYGNSENAPKYKVRVDDRAGNVRLNLEFDAPAAGQGVGYAQGQVQQVVLEFPPETAEALAHALQPMSKSTVGGPFTFSIDETAGLPVDA
jgi:hypothetical protein